MKYPKTRNHSFAFFGAFSRPRAFSAKIVIKCANFKVTKILGCATAILSRLVFNRLNLTPTLILTLTPTLTLTLMEKQQANLEKNKTKSKRENHRNIRYRMRASSCDRCPK